MKKLTIFVAIFLILIAMIDLQNLRPINNTLVDELLSLKTRLNQLERARQPYVSDWQEITEPSTGAVSGVVTFTNTGFVARDYFSIGDKIRLKQGGAYKYFYVIIVSIYGSANAITVNGGDDYTLTATAITDLAFSKASNPTGHPIGFRYTPTVTADGAMTVSANADVSYFYMIGRSVFYSWYIEVTLGGVVSTTIRLSIPFNTTTGAVYYIGRQFIYTQNTTSRPVLIDVNTTPQLFFEVYNQDFTNWTAGSCIIEGLFTAFI
jgi:hypothetical protein